MHLGSTYLSFTVLSKIKIPIAIKILNEIVAEGNYIYWRGNMSEKNIVLIPGDGIGTEIIAAAKAVCDVAFEKANVKVNWIDERE